MIYLYAMRRNNVCFTAATAFELVPIASHVPLGATPTFGVFMEFVPEAPWYPKYRNPEPA
jgi:hypothetical protein